MRILFILLLFFNCFIIFPNNFEEKRRLFASEGFGFQYNLEENASRSLFIINHGNPLHIIEYDTMVENHIIFELEYQHIIVNFYEINENPRLNFPESQLISIFSKNNIEYLFGIRHGMNINDFIEIFGEIDTSDFDFHPYIWFSDSGKSVTIGFEDNKLKSIVWSYPRRFWE